MRTLNQKAALLIRTLLADLRVSDKIMFPRDKEPPSFTSGAVLEELDAAREYPTEDAYLRACRALHWHTAQLRAHGIEPDPIAPDAPHYPPEGHRFASQGIEVEVTDTEPAISEQWKSFRSDFNNLTDQEVERERASSQNVVDEEERWLEAVAAWEAAGKPRDAI